VIVYWTVFVKSKLIIDNNLISICLNKNKLNVELAESANYISSIETKTSKDTLEIFVRTTSMYNPFSNKEIHKILDVPSQVSYIKVGSKLTSISVIRTCK
jgi:hypothetical protein